MNRIASDRRQGKTSKFAFLSLLVLLAGGILYFLHSFIHSFILGVLIASILHPVHRRIESWMRRLWRILRRTRAGRLVARVRFRDTPQGWEQRLKRRHTGLLGKLLWPLTGIHASMHRFLTVSRIDYAKSTVQYRRWLSALLSTTLLVILVALPTVLLVRTAILEGRNTLEHGVQRLQSDGFRQSLADFYQRESTRDFLVRLEESPLGRAFLAHLERKLDSPDLLRALDNYMNSLIPDDMEHALAQDLGKERKPGAPETAAPPGAAEGVRARAGGEPPQILRKLEQTLYRFSRSILRISQFLIMKGLSGIGGLVFGLFVMIVVIFFMFYQGSHLYHFFRQVGPFSEDDYEIITRKIRDVSVTVALGILGTACIQGIVAMVGYRLAGLPAFFLGILTASCAIIPFVGTALVWIPSALYLLITGEPRMALLVALWGSLLVANIDGLLRPLLMSGGKARLSYGVLFFAILCGLNTFGLLGIFYGPLLAGVFITCLDIFARKYRN